MSRHETWRWIVLMMVGVLALSGLLRLGPTVVTLGLLTAGMAAAARLAWVLKRDGKAKTGWDAWSEAWRPATIGFVGVLVLNGLHTLFGSAAPPIGIAAAITALVAFLVLRLAPDASGGNAAAAPASTPPRPPGAPRRPPDAPPVRALPTSALCWEWRRSYLAVTRASEPDELTRIAALRAAYLDELERRNPVGFRRWLASGARAASDPGRYLTSG
jgi:hypothetical protein